MLGSIDVPIAHELSIPRQRMVNGEVPAHGRCVTPMAERCRTGLLSDS